MCVYIYITYTYIYYIYTGAGGGGVVLASRARGCRYGHLARSRHCRQRQGTQFTCFTGTKVRILTQLRRGGTGSCLCSPVQCRERWKSWSCGRIRGTGALLPLSASRCTSRLRCANCCSSKVFSLLASLVQKYEFLCVGVPVRELMLRPREGTQFTCFTGTTIHILTELRRMTRRGHLG